MYIHFLETGIILRFKNNIYNVCSFLWHRVSFFLFSLIKIIIKFKNAQKERKANVSATYGGPLQ